MATITISLTSPAGNPSVTKTFADADIVRLLAFHLSLLPAGATNAQAFQLMVQRMLEGSTRDVQQYEQSRPALVNFT
jgi:hypothetical protein